MQRDVAAAREGQRKTKMKREYDVVVIGGGVVGLWTALTAARRGCRVALLERCSHVGSMSTSRNSGVLHGGIYYEPESLKAEHCVRGRHLSIEFLRDHKVPFEICGKYVVPTTTQEPDDSHYKDLTGNEQDATVELERLRDRAHANGVEEVEIVSIDRSELSFLHAERALHVRCTGIVDLPSYVRALDHAVREAGVDVYLDCACISAGPGWLKTHTTDLPDDASNEVEFRASCIVNSAGLYADVVAAMFGMTGFQVQPNKGSYFRLRSPLSVRTLIYPLPSNHSTFLGVHYTPDMQSSAWVGPNSTWAADKADFLPEGDREAFYGGLSRIVNGYAASDLIGPEKAGLRSRLFENGKPAVDFVIREHPPGVCHLLGIESPGLTAAPSLAQEVLSQLGVL